MGGEGKRGREEGQGFVADPAVERTKRLKIGIVETRHRTEGGLPATPLQVPEGPHSYNGIDQAAQAIDLEPFRSETNITGYRGVRWESSSRKYHAQIKVNGRNTYLGHFDTVEPAARAYARAYLSEHGGQAPVAAAGTSFREMVRLMELQRDGATNIQPHAPPAPPSHFAAQEIPPAPGVVTDKARQLEEGEEEEENEEEIELEPF